MALRLKVCAVADLVDDIQGFDVDGVDYPIMIAKVGDDYVATSSICPHEDVSLLNGSFDGRVVTCPGHAYEFDLVTGHCEPDDRLCLRRFRVSVDQGWLWVELV